MDAQSPPLIAPTFSVMGFVNRSYGGGGETFISVSSSRSDWITERLFSIAFVAFLPSAACPGTPVIRTLNHSTPT